MNRFVSAICLIVAFAYTMPTHAAGLIYGDIAGNNVASGYGIGPGGGINNFIAEGFKMTGTYNLQSVDVYLAEFQSNAGSNIALSIFNDNGGVPGTTDLYDLSTNINIPLSGSPADVNLAGSGSFTLNAGSTYWLEMYATNPSSQNGTFAVWSGEFTPGSTFATPTGPGATEIGQIRTYSGGVTTSELRTAFQLNGVAVPEPSTLALLTLGAVSLLAVRRR